MLSSQMDNTQPDIDARLTMNFTREAVNFGGELSIKPNEEADQEQLKQKMLSLKEKQMEQPVCRICLSEEEEGNPLISPCKCTGSLSNIHLECIREWLEGKKHMKETPYVNSYIWKQLECEICKNPYSDVTKLKSGEEVTLLKYSVH